MRHLRSLAAVLVVALAATACSALRDPIAPWSVAVAYEGTPDTVRAEPAERHVDGPFGFLSLTNNTPIERGFAIWDLAVFEKIIPDATVNVHIEEAQDGHRYPFYDHVNGSRDEPLGYISVTFKAEDER